MNKRLKLATRAFGAEPGIPCVADLAAWIAEHRGTLADIITYLLDRSLHPQTEAGILAPCAGGRFYKSRIMDSLLGVEGGKVTGEIALDCPAIREDADAISGWKKGIWCAVPAPHTLGITDGYYNDESEWSDAITGLYRTLMRSMRDGGIRGHVLICDALSEPEIIPLCGQNVFFFQPEPGRDGLECLLEHQQQVAVGRKQIDLVLDLTSEYDIRRLIIIDPDPASIAHALTCFDPDQISAGGYCTEMDDRYWKNLAESAACPL